MEAQKETSHRVVSYSIPTKDYAFLRRLSQRMGWKLVAQPRQKKTRLQRAIEEAHKGPTFQTNDIDELMAHLME